MRYSRLFNHTVKELPKDAVLKSHILLLRANLVVQSGAGLYALTPLGLKIYDKIAAIIRKEMNKSGAQEVALPFVTSASLWERSGRYEKYGSELLRLIDRKGSPYLLSPTHEEPMTALVAASIKSYKQLPVHLYQIGPKFRDEARPRFGLIRGREFVMKDGYSFHASKESLDETFDTMEATYSAIFDELGIDYRVVAADSGAIGGSGSREFMALASCGEDTLVVCESCSYAANMEVATSKIAPHLDDALASLGAIGDEIATPSMPTIAALTSGLKIDERSILKAVVKRAILGSEEGIKTDKGTLSKPPKSLLVIYYIRADYALEETKALNALNALGFNALELDDEIKDSTLVSGYIGLGASKEAVSIFDFSLKDAKALLAGANKEDFHTIIDMQEAIRDNKLNLADIRCVKEGEACSRCGKPLVYKKGIEAGHIFKLGTRYSSPLNANFLDENGRSKPFIMGCYGIGVSRLLSIILEQNADEFGCVFTPATTIFDAEIIISNMKNKAEVKLADALYEAGRAKGLDILLDDRPARFGEKIKDFELLGCAKRAVIVGKRLDEGKVELIERRGLKRHECSASIDEILGKLG